MTSDCDRYASLCRAELRIEVTRRTALHLLRYASAMMHPTARGVVYLVMALTLLSSWSDSGYLLEVRSRLDGCVSLMAN